MAGKAATVYLIDVGNDMGQKHNGRSESDLDYGMNYIWDKVAGTLATSRSTLLVGLTGVRTDTTSNPLADERGLEGYENICVWKKLGSIAMGDVRHLQSIIRPSKTTTGDVLSAIVLAIEEITQATTLKTGKLGKYDRNIVLLTNGRGGIDADDADQHLVEIAKKLNAMEIHLTIACVASLLSEDMLLICCSGVDFDDAEFGFKEEDKDRVKVRG